MSLKVITDRNIMIVRTDRLDAGLLLFMPACCIVIGIGLCFGYYKEWFWLPLGMVVLLLSMVLLRHLSGFINDLEYDQMTGTLKVHRLIPFLRRRWMHYRVDEIKSITYDPETVLSKGSWGSARSCISINLKDGGSVPVLEMGMSSTIPLLDARRRHLEMAHFMRIPYFIYKGSERVGHYPPDE